MKPEGHEIEDENTAREVQEAARRGPFLIQLALRRVPSPFTRAAWSTRSNTSSPVEHGLRPERASFATGDGLAVLPYSLAIGIGNIANHSNSQLELQLKSILTLR